MRPEIAGGLEKSGFLRLGLVFGHILEIFAAFQSSIALDFGEGPIFGRFSAAVWLFRLVGFDPPSGLFGLDLPSADLDFSRFRPCQTGLFLSAGFQDFFDLRFDAFQLVLLCVFDRIFKLKRQK